jgi:predicted RNase H-like HicB family nuclease
VRYTVILERDPTGLIVAHVPALRGCVSQGRTKREALRNIKEAIALYVETLIDNGQPVPTEAAREVVELTVEAKRASCRGNFRIAKL